LRIRFDLLDTADMTMTTLLHRLCSLLPPCAFAFALALLIGANAPLHAQSVAVLVNGEPITNYDIEQRTKLNFLSTHKQ
jgi:peptidyl-prolyl cis-trans isomerase SurA